VHRDILWSLNEKAKAPGIEVRDTDHMGLVAGIIDEIGLVGQVDRKLGTDPRERVSCGRAVKAMILDGLDFLSPEMNGRQSPLDAQLSDGSSPLTSYCESGAPVSRGRRPSWPPVNTATFQIGDAPDHRLAQRKPGDRRAE
jgi:hypothetical protein